MSPDLFGPRAEYLAWCYAGCPPLQEWHAKCRALADEMVKIPAVRNTLDAELAKTHKA